MEIIVALAAIAVIVWIIGTIIYGLSKGEDWS